MPRPYPRTGPAAPNVARPPDPNRRKATLVQATDYVLKHGLAGLSLRPLASALHTSTRMLLYDFGTKENLVTEVLAEIRERQTKLLEQAPDADLSLEDAINAIWNWVSTPERAPYARLFFELSTDALARPERYPDDVRHLASGWLDSFPEALKKDDEDQATLTLTLAVIRGLLLDRMITDDTRRTDAAIARFVDVLAAANDKHALQ